jgi:MFS family permease
MAVYAAMSGAGAAVGLILGGALTEASWRWTFFINTPIGLIVAVLAIRFLGESARQTGKFDLPGAITGTVGLTSLVYGLTHAAQSGWGDATTIAFIAAGVILIGVFLSIEARSRHALMPFRILANRTRGISFFVMLIVGAAVFSMFYFLGIFIQNIMGYSALKTGFAFLPFSFGIVIAAQIASALISRIDPRWISGVGAALLGGGMFGFSQLAVDSTYLTDLLPFILLLSCGMGLIFVPLTLTAVSGVANEDSGVGSAVLNTVQQIGGAIGLALLGTVSTTAIKDKFAELAPGLGKAAESGQSPDQLKQLQGQFQAVATTHGFTRAFLVSGFIILGAAIITVIGLSVKHEDLANDGQPGGVHVG